MRILIMVLALGGGALPLAPAVAAPQTGTCLNLPAAARTQTLLPSAYPVDCATPHTAEIVGVVKGAGLTVPDAFQSCQAKAVTYLGGFPTKGPGRSSYMLPRTAELTVYLSGSRERAYCVGFNTSARGRVKPRMTSVKGTGLKPRVCLDAVSWGQESCARSKAVDFRHVVWLSESAVEPYPGNTKVLARTRTLCMEFAKTWGYVAEAWFTPGNTQWSLGNRYAYCRAVPDQTDTGWGPVP